MTDNPFDAMMKLGQDWAQTLNPALASFMPKDLDKLWPTMPREWMETAMGKAFNPEGLDAKTRMLLTLAGMTVQGVPVEPAFRTAVRHARAAGATKQEIAEAIAQMGMFAGVPAMSKALSAAQTALGDDDEGDAQT